MSFNGVLEEREARRPAPARIVVVGGSGSGKTTLARELSRRLDAPHIELDALHWGPDWTPNEDFQDRVAEALAGEAWVIDGGYSAVRDLIWSRATALVWLDYPLPTILFRQVRRTFRRIRTREEMWNGNRETLRVHLCRDGILWWSLTTHRKRRLKYAALLRQPEFAHLNVFRHPSPSATREWLDRVTTAPDLLLPPTKENQAAR